MRASRMYKRGERSRGVITTASHIAAMKLVRGMFYSSPARTSKLRKRRRRGRCSGNELSLKMTVTARMHRKYNTID